MARGPLPDDVSDSRITELDDGFSRLGDTDTPYTLVSGQEKRDKAITIHNERSVSDQNTDERTNEPVTRDLEQWQNNLWKYDFPFVDTVPHSRQVERATLIADLAFDLGYLDEISDGVDFDDPHVRGRFWQHPPEIELRANPDDFLGFRKGPALAHELGHAFYAGIGLGSTFADTATDIFRTTKQEEHARSLAVRLHGPFIDAPPGLQDHREHPRELFADVFAARVIEPEAARRNGPAAVKRVEAILKEQAPQYPFIVLSDAHN